MFSYDLNITLEEPRCFRKLSELPTKIVIVSTWRSWQCWTYGLTYGYLVYFDFSFVIFFISLFTHGYIYPYLKVLSQGSILKLIVNIYTCLHLLLQRADRKGTIKSNEEDMHWIHIIYAYKLFIPQYIINNYF